MSNNLVFIGDWSNLKRGQNDMLLNVGEYNKEIGFKGIKDFLDGIGIVTRSYIYSPLHDVYGHFEFLREQDQGFTIVLTPVVAKTQEDTTDAKLIEDALDLIANYNMTYLCIGSGDHHFAPVLRSAKRKGIKVAVVYGSERSLSWEIRTLADQYPIGHQKAGQPMLHLFSPKNEELI